MCLREVALLRDDHLIQVTVQRAEPGTVALEVERTGLDTFDRIDAIETIINDYKEHSNIKLIKSNVQANDEKFSMPPVTEAEVE